MQNNKVFRLLIGKDVAVSTSGVTTETATVGSIVPFTQNWVELATTDIQATSPTVYVIQKITSDSATKIGNAVSLPILWTGVRNYKGESFRPEQEQITYVGAAPAANTTLALGTGDITLTAGEEYAISIINKEEKEKIQVPSRYDVIATATDTKATLLGKFATLINNDTNSVCDATVIGNGTGTDGLTGATAYGLKLKGIAGKYFFEVGVYGGFSDAPITYDTVNYPGSGTYDQMIELEKVSNSYLGVLNRIWMPKTVTSYVAAQSDSQLGSTSASGTITFTQDSKAVTTGTGNISGTLVAGDALNVAGVKYVIKSVVLSGSDTDSIVLTEPFKGSTVTYTATTSLFSTAEVAKYEGYDLVVIDHDNIFDSAVNFNTTSSSCQTIVAFPSYLAQSTAKSTFLNAFNAWVNNGSTDTRFPDVSV